MWLMVGSFFVPNGLSSNLGLMMFSYGFNTMAGLTAAGATQIRFSNSQGDSWSSNLIRSLSANVPKIYITKGLGSILPFSTHFTWKVREYSYVIDKEPVYMTGYRTYSEAWLIFKNYLS